MAAARWLHLPAEPAEPCRGVMSATSLSTGFRLIRCFQHGAAGPHTSSIPPSIRGTRVHAVIRDSPNGECERSGLKTITLLGQLPGGGASDASEVNGRKSATRRRDLA